MKVILLFALFGISFCQASEYGGNEDCPSPYRPDPSEYTCQTPPSQYKHQPNCLAQALRESTAFLEEVSGFLCEYKACKSGNPTGNFKEAAKRLVNALACLECDLVPIFGFGCTYEDILAELDEFLDRVGPLIDRIVGSLGIAQPVVDALCSVVGGVLQTQCVQLALANLGTSAVQQLGIDFCGDGDRVATIGRCAKTLRETGCDLAGLDEDLEDILESLDDLLDCVLGSVLSLTGQLPVVGPLLCSVLNGLLGAGGILNGVLTGILGTGTGGLLGTGGILEILNR